VKKYLAIILGISTIIAEIFVIYKFNVSHAGSVIILDTEHAKELIIQYSYEYLSYVMVLLTLIAIIIVNYSRRISFVLYMVVAVVSALLSYAHIPFFLLVAIFAFVSGVYTRLNV